MRPAKIVAIVIGVLLILIGLGVLVPGVIVLGINSAANSDGYLTTAAHSLNSDGYALATPDVKLHLGSGDWVPGDWSAQVKATSTNGKAIFVGIGPTAQVTDYLSAVSYDRVTNWSWGSSGDPQYTTHEGSASATLAPPGQQTFWVTKQEGDGAQAIQWHIQSGDWTAVVMNADGSAPVAASVSIGAHLGFLLPLGIGLTVGGVVLLAIGIVLVVLGARRPRGPAQQPAYVHPGPSGQPPYVQPGQPPYGQSPPSYQPYQQPPYGQPAQAPYQPPYQQPPYQAPPPPPPVVPPEASPPDAQPPAGQ